MQNRMPEYAKNNLEDIPFAQYMKHYQKMNPLEASMRAGVPFDADTRCFRLHMLEREYLVSHPDLTITRVTEDGQYRALESDKSAQILAMRFLLRGLNIASTGEFLTYREVPNGEVYFRQFSGRCLKRLAYAFGSQPEKMEAAIEKLGAKRLTLGDVSCELEIFKNYYVRWILWAGDEEFPPSAQMLFSDNFPLSFDPGDMAVIGDISIDTLKKL